MTSTSDKELRKEIAYLTKLIESHKKTSAAQRKPISKLPGKTSRFKWTATTGPKSPKVASSNRVYMNSECTPQQSGPLGTRKGDVRGSRNVMAPLGCIPMSKQASKHHHLYHYSNSHHHGSTVHSHGKFHHCPGNRHCSTINRKWSNESVRKVKESKKSTNLMVLPTRHGTASVVRSGELRTAETPTVASDQSKRHAIAHTLSKPAPCPLSKQPGASSTQQSSVGVASSTPCILQTSAASSEGKNIACSTSLEQPKIPIAASPHGEVRPNSRLKWTRSAARAKTPRTLNHRYHCHKISTVAVSSKAEITPSSSKSYSHVTGRRRLGTGSGSRYKWRRRSTPSSPSSKKAFTVKTPTLKSPTSARIRPHTPSWIIHNRYKLTHASIVHKYSKIMHRQRTTSLAKLSRSATRRSVSRNTSLRKLRPRNKVWRSADAESSRNDAQSATTAQPSRRLSGHELKTRQGNRQWVSKRVNRSPSGQQVIPSRRSSWGHKPFGGSPFGLSRRRLSGHEMKTRHGNRQWISRRVARRPLQSVVVNYPRGATYNGQRWKRGQDAQQLVSLSGQKFVLDSGGCRLKRLSTSSPLHLHLRSRFRSRGTSTSANSHQSSTIKQYLASRAVQRSRMYVWNAKQRKKKETKQYCIFYNRFGKCNRGDACPYVHDPTKIAICSKFLRGMCDKTDGSCVFSHTMTKDKMPTCSFFLRGVCTREVCPYLHPVATDRHAKVCLDFARGYCPKGQECTKHHVVDCPDYSEKGSCPRGDRCLLRHRKGAPKRKTTPTRVLVAPTKTPLAFKRLQLRKRDMNHREAAGISQTVVVASGSSHDNSTVSCDNSADDDRQLCYSPLDPSCPAPDFLAL